MRACERGKASDTLRPAVAGGPDWNRLASRKLPDSVTVSTTDFDSVCPGSNPGRATLRHHIASDAESDLRTGLGADRSESFFCFPTSVGDEFGNVIRKGLCIFYFREFLGAITEVRNAESAEDAEIGSSSGWCSSISLRSPRPQRFGSLVHVLLPRVCESDRVVQRRNLGIQFCTAPSSLLKKGGRGSRRAMCVRKVACFSRLGRSLALPTTVFNRLLRSGVVVDGSNSSR